MVKNYILFFLLMLFSVAVSNAQDPGTENLTHLWTFEDGTANDEVGDADGDFNGLNVFVEAGDLVTVPNETDSTADSWLELPGDQIDIGGTYTEVSVAAWFTPDTLNIQWNTLWFFGDDGGGTGYGSDGISLQPRRNDNHARFWFTAGASQGFNAEDGVNDDAYGNYNNDTLYHVVCEVILDSIKMYHDGVLVGTTPLTNNAVTGEIKNIADISPNFARFAHGCYSGDTPWLGRIHEVAIYNKALSDEEVLFLFQKGITTTSVEGQDGQLPKTFSLSQNYPNPFNPGTRISFNLPKESHVKMKVYDMLGKEVAMILDEVKPAGRHNISFDGSKLTSGVYLYTMDTGDQVVSRKMVLLK